MAIYSNLQLLAFNIALCEVVNWEKLAQCSALQWCKRFDKYYVCSERKDICREDSLEKDKLTKITRLQVAEYMLAQKEIKREGIVIFLFFL